MKKTLVLFVVLVTSVLLLVGCTPKDKTYTSGEFSIVLPGNFKEASETEMYDLDFAVERGDSEIVGMFFEKSTLNGMTLESLAHQSMRNIPNLDNPTLNFENEATIPFYHFEYEEVVDNVDVTALLVFLENDDTFFTLVITSYTKRYEKQKPIFFEWLNTITLEK